MKKDESLKRVFFSLYSKMNKRGQVELVVGVFILGAVLITGAIGAISSIGSVRYVVDISNNNTIYDLAKCDVKFIPKENLKPLSDFNELARKNFPMAECSK